MLPNDDYRHSISPPVSMLFSLMIVVPGRHVALPFLQFSRSVLIYPDRQERVALLNLLLPLSMAVVPAVCLFVA